MADLLYIHSDAGEGSTEFVDLSGNDIALTANGNVKHSTTQAKFGSSSIAFDGTLDYITGTLATAIGTGDFTLDFWVYYSGSVTTKILFDIRGSTGATSNGFTIYTNNTAMSFYTAGGIRIAGPSLAADTFVHIALVRSSSVTKLYVNGTGYGSYADSNNYSLTLFRIGEQQNSTGFCLNGYIDELRIRNEAVWTADFTPPRTAYISKDSYRDLVMANSPCNYWRLGEASGNAIDERGEHDLTWAGTPVYEAAGALVNDTDTAMTLDGTTEYARKVTGHYRTDQSGSVEAWVYLHAANACCLFQTGDESNTYTMQFWAGRTDGAKPEIRKNNGTWASVKSNTTMSLNEWHHIVFLCDGASWSIYVDGVSTGVTVVESSNAGTWFGDITATDNVVIGGIYLAPAFRNGLFNGTLDEVAVYDYPLSPQQIWRHYIEGSHLKQAGTRYEHRILMSKPVNYWRLDDVLNPYADDANTLLLIHSDTTNGSTTFTDSSSNGVVLTPVGNVNHSTVQKKLGATSIYFDGAGDYITAGSSIDLGANDFTIDFWYMPLSKTNYSAIFAGDTQDYPLCFYHGSGTAGGNPAIAFGSSTAWYGPGLFFGAVTNGVWYHLAFVRSGDTYYAFKDGVQQDTWTDSTPGRAIGVLTAPQWGRNATFYLGMYLDEFRISNTARWTANFAVPTIHTEDKMGEHHLTWS